MSDPTPGDPAPRDPVRLWMRRERATIALGAGALACSLAWSLWPLAGDTAPDTALRAPAADAASADAPAPLDLAAFSARIWNPLPAPEPTVAASAAPTGDRPLPPPRLQLIGIVRDADDTGAVILRAALYDPDTDRLHLAASGERVGAVAIASIDDGAVILQSGEQTTRLALRDEEGRR